MSTQFPESKDLICAPHGPLDNHALIHYNRHGKSCQETRMDAWHTHPAAEVLNALGASEAGLSPVAAAERLKTHGPNEIRERRGMGPLAMLRKQFSEALVLILILAALISALLGKGAETAAILASAVLITVLGFIRGYRAERANTGPRQPAAPAVRVRRGRTLRELPVRDLVPGDIVLLEAGNAVPADVRLLESTNLRIQEAALTGGSEAVEKTAAAIPQPDLPFGDRRNMAYLGTSVTSGGGQAVVVATGMKTELGKITTLIQEAAADKTPLQKQFDRLGRTLAAAGGIAAGLVLPIGWWSSEPLADMFLTIANVAVAVVPEALPAVVVLSLAFGSQRILRRNALIRRQPAVETLGAVTVICSDKTGTLTENRMTITIVDAAGERLNLVVTLRRRLPSVTADEFHLDARWSVPVPIRLALAAGALCNDAVLQPDAGPACFHASGDPTEGALLVAAARCGMLPEHLQSMAPRVAEVPFDSNRKRMTTVHRLAGAGAVPAALQVFQGAGHVAFSKGAVDGLLGVSTQVWIKGRPEPLTDSLRDQIRAVNEELARSGMRVLAVACRALGAVPPAAGGKELERDLTFLGMVGLMDPPRAGVKPAVAACQAAGIRTVMITGDHPLTAAAAARDLGMADRPKAIDGPALNRMGPSDLAEAVDRVSVYARVSPEDKLRIAAALKQRGQVVAMTGGGAHDAPALKKADIGVAMGATGTAVSREAAHMVLLDDNFAAIVAAVREGRVIYANLRRFIKFSLGGNVGKLLVLLAAPIFGIHAALQPLQLLWLNLLTDGLMGLGLGVEPAEADTMRRPPCAPNAPVLDRAMRIHIGWVGTVIAAASLGLGALYFDPAQPENTTWQSMIFAGLGFAQIGHALGLRASGQSVFPFGPNPAMGVLTLATLALQLAVIYIPYLGGFFGLSPLPLKDLGLAFGMGVLAWVCVQVENRMLHRPNQ
jgi:Ca2+-transporting ATPase